MQALDTVAFIDSINSKKPKKTNKHVFNDYIGTKMNIIQVGFFSFSAFYQDENHLTQPFKHVQLSGI